MVAVPVSGFAACVVEAGVVVEVDVPEGVVLAVVVPPAAAAVVDDDAVDDILAYSLRR